MFGLFCIGLLLVGLGGFLYYSRSVGTAVPEELRPDATEIPGALHGVPTRQPANTPPAVPGTPRWQRQQKQRATEAPAQEGHDKDGPGQPLISEVGLATSNDAEQARVVQVVDTARPQSPRSRAARPSPGNRRSPPTPQWTETQLVEQLRRVPTLKLATATMAEGVAAATKEQSMMAAPHPEAALRHFVRAQPVLGQIPFRRGDEAKLAKQQAKDIDFLSPRLRAVIQACTVANGSQNPFEPAERIDAQRLRQILLQGKMTHVETVDNNELRLKATLKTWRQPAAVSTLNQILMAEGPEVRLVLVELLGQIEGKEAIAALAQKAVFDPAASVRKAAIGQLQTRPHDEVRPGLLAGLRHPWLPANYHAAQALLALKDLDAIPALELVLDEPDPREPRLVEQSGTHQFAVAEVVKVNHLQNCLLCHGPSHNDYDVLRRPMPEKILDRQITRAQNSTRARRNELGELAFDQRNVVNSGWLSTGFENGNASEGSATEYYAGSGPPAGAGGAPINGFNIQIGPLRTRTKNFHFLSIFIRGDLIFAQQDVSLQISSPIFTKEGLLANQDRFDFLVRMKPLTAEEYAERVATGRLPNDIRRHEAVRYALDQLTALHGQEVAKRPPSYQPEGKPVEADPGTR